MIKKIYGVNENDEKVELNFKRFKAAEGARFFNILPGANRYCHKLCKKTNENIYQGVCVFDLSDKMEGTSKHN